MTENELRQKVIATVKKYIGCKEQQDNNTTYSNATSSAAGLMSAADKEKLDKMVVISAADYENLDPPDSNTIYFVLEATS